MADPQAEGFIQCPEQQRLAMLLRETVERWGADDPEKEYRLLRALLMGAGWRCCCPVRRCRWPGCGPSFPPLRLDWELGRPAGGRGERQVADHREPGPVRGGQR